MQWWLCIAWLTGLILTSAALQGCGCNEEKWGYDCDAFSHYQVTNEHTTPGGVHFQGPTTSDEQVDSYVNAVDTCLVRNIDRDGFVVLVAPDWYPEPAACVSPAWGPQELLPVPAPESGCTAKGYAASANCPCEWRGGLRCPGSDSDGRTVLVETGNLLMLKDNLIRWTLNTTDPWTTTLAPCATP
jgi:hypothetical protein